MEYFGFYSEIAKMRYELILMNSILVIFFILLDSGLSIFSYYIVLCSTYWP